MKRSLLTLSFMLFVLVPILSQNRGLPIEATLNYGIYEGDTVQQIHFRDVNVFAPIKFKNNKERQEYTRLIRDVKIAYPYAKKVAYAVVETYEYMETLPDDKTKQKYLDDVQKFMMNEYKPKLKKLTKRQGQILVKLIDRECNTSSYNIVKAIVGSFKAGVYNAFAGLFGNSLKAEYDPRGKDAAIETIVLQIEDGSVDYYYARNYHGFGK